MELAQFHSEDYVDFLNRVTPDTQHVRYTIPPPTMPYPLRSTLHPTPYMAPH